MAFLAYKLSHSHLYFWQHCMNKYFWSVNWFQKFKDLYLICLSVGSDFSSSTHFISTHFVNFSALIHSGHSQAIICNRCSFISSLSPRTNYSVKQSIEWRSKFLDPHFPTHDVMICNGSIFSFHAKKQVTIGSWIL